MILNVYIKGNLIHINILFKPILYSFLIAYMEDYVGNAIAKADMMLLRKKTMEKQNQGEIDNEKERNKVKTNYQDKKLLNQYNSICYDEQKRAMSLKTKRARIDELKMIEGNEVIEKINNEISNSMKKKSWKTMDLCFKWTLVNNYVKNLDPLIVITNSDLDSLKSSLQSKTLNVDYDKKSQTIRRLNFMTENNEMI